jgi:undecaprenyl diphosphate synthase
MSGLLQRFEGYIAPGGREAEVISLLDPDRLPRHVAVIMDGNGRWAAQRDMPRVAGHRAGTEAVRSTIETSARLGISVLTLYAFSAENWKRPAAEVSTLMGLLKHYLRQELPTIQEKGIRFRPIGRMEDLPLSIRKELLHASEVTCDNSTMDLIVALNYSGRLELVDAFNRMVQEGIRYPIEEQDISDHLYTRDIPDPDLLIRTSGEKRISNFLLWQIAYSEIYVTEVLWPDFRSLQLLEAILDFQKRERRYGGIFSRQYQTTR